MTATARQVLVERFGYDAFRPGQEQVIDALLEGRSALAVFPTGGGKSLCYQLPALLLDGLTVVVSPLIALMKDQIDALAARGIPSARLDSSLARDEATAVGARIASGELRLLYVAPERFTNERFLALLRRTPIALFAVDEAHCISEWGHNFRPDYLKLARRATELGAERVLALTATATPQVVRDVCAAFGIADDDAVVTGFHRENLELRTTPVTSATREPALLERIGSRPAGPTIVYVTYQRQAVELARTLADAGHPARAYHAGMDPADRGAVQEWWTAAPAGIVVATIAFGMGIDRADVRYVYHAALPKSLESYAQETGRAGRDGLPATCELLACAADVPGLENFAYGDTPTRDALEALVEELLGHPPGELFAVSEHELAGRFDIRPLVLRTALTYLELAAVLHQGTPFYAGYRIQPVTSFDDVYARFDGERAAFLRGVVEAGRAGRVWTTLAPDDVAAALGSPRERIVAAIDYLAEQGLIVAEAAEARQRYTVLEPASEVAALVELLAGRFARREQAEVDRIAQVVALVESPTCQVALLVGRFGEVLPGPCGHCTVCLDGPVGALPAEPVPPIAVDAAALEALVAEHADALGEPRQQARFLCGVTSPATTRARITREPLFGTLAERPFADVLAWCEERAAVSRRAAP
jgi:ATP-dependent DNA helicase RecQ